MKPTLDRDTLLHHSALYDDATYPDDPYLDHLEALRQAVRCLFLWKLGKISLHPTPTSQPLSHVDPDGRCYHAVGMTGAHQAAIARATEAQRLRAGMRFRVGEWCADRQVLLSAATTGLRATDFTD